MPFLLPRSSSVVPARRQISRACRRDTVGDVRAIGRRHDQLLALIAHELRHALEVIEHDEVVDLPTMEAMYARIGVPMAGLSGHETSAARAAGASVLDELTAPRSTP